METSQKSFLVDVSEYQVYKNIYKKTLLQKTKLYLYKLGKEKLWEIIYTVTFKLQYILLDLEGEVSKKGEEKFSEFKILMLASLVPENVDKTILGISEFYPDLSKRQVCKILKEIKDKYPTWWRTARWVDEQ